jgi:hypothetical protein
LNAIFLEWMERLQKCVQVDGECIGWAERTQYIEIDFNREIRLCYTWRGTPYIMSWDNHKLNWRCSPYSFVSATAARRRNPSGFRLFRDFRPRIRCHICTFQGRFRILGKGLSTADKWIGSVHPNTFLRWIASRCDCDKSWSPLLRYPQLIQIRSGQWPV